MKGAPAARNVPRFTAAELLAAVDCERDRTAQALHDSLCQTMGAVALTCQMLQRGLRGGEAPEELRERCDQLEEMTREALHQTRELMLNRQGRKQENMVTALGIYFEEVGRWQPCTFTVAGEGAAPTGERGLAMLRFAQEAVEWARARAGGESIEVRLRLAPDIMRLEIRAEGGESDERKNVASAVELLKLRAEVMGAALEFGEGWLECRLPLTD